MSLLKEKLKNIQLVPVVTPYSVEGTVELAKTLIAGGVNAIEITLRTDLAMEATQAVKDSGVDIVLGVGTLTSVQDVKNVAALGVDFAVSPGLTPAILNAAKEYDLDLLPGISSASDILLGMEYGYDFFKVFPAEAVNAYELIKSFQSVFPNANFCPTGGINLSNINKYLALPSILCAGGSWILPAEDIKAGNWQKIESLCKEAIAHIESGAAG
jgi:2-dehydro-3-deoxyphosphogluconate aldolase / (4S)-4-hydroxy-2-oxoglutarate aldolase